MALAAVARASLAASATASGGLIKLHGFPASPTSILARITLNLKGVPYEFIPLAPAPPPPPPPPPPSKLHNDDETLTRTTTTSSSSTRTAAAGAGGGGGERGSSVVSLNGFRSDVAGGSMPWLEDGGHRVTQTGAIFNYINEVYPTPPLLPRDVSARARVRSIATYVACEIQPLGFYRVLRYLSDEGGKDAQWVSEWRRHWLREGFATVEAELSEIGDGGKYCYGDMPTMADVFLIPQVHISQGPDIEIDLSSFPYLKRLYNNCLENPAFSQALPQQSPSPPSPPSPSSSSS